MNKLVTEIIAAAVDGIETAVHEIKATKSVLPKYPEDHLLAMEVPEGGSSCAKCEYVNQDMDHCSNTYFIEWEGPNKPKDSSELPMAANKYCCDFFAISKKIKAGGPGSGRRPGGCEVCNTSTKGNVCAKCAAAIVQYAEENNLGHAEALEDMQRLYEKHGEGVLKKYSDTFNQSLENALRLSLKNLKAGGPGSGRKPGDTIAYYKKGDNQTWVVEPKPDEGDPYYKPKGQYMHQVGDGPKVKGGYFMDFHDSDIQDKFKLNEKQYNALSFEDRAKVNAAVQNDKYLTSSKFKTREGITQYEKFVKQSRLEAASENSFAGMFKGTMWNGVRIVGFTGPEEEGLRAMLSRVPPELLYPVKCIEAAPELEAKHGRFLPDKATVQFNPHNFLLRQRFGKGENWILHQELTTVHEIGHGIFHSLPEEKQNEWKTISGWMEGWKPGQSLPYVEKRPGWGNAKSDWTHKAGIKFTRHYAERNPDEDFADSFAFVIMNKGHQMEPAKKAFIDCLIKEKVKKYNKVTIESPSKPYGPASPTPKSVIEAANNFNELLYNILAGGPGSGRHKEKEAELSDKAKRALATYVPQDKSKVALATLNELLIAKAIGGTTESPQVEYRKAVGGVVRQKGANQTTFDVYKGKVALEVKTLSPTAKNDKLTCHPESCDRKNKAIKDNKLKAFTVAVDMRTKPSTYYYRSGVGSFRLNSMNKVEGIEKLKEVLK